MMVKAGADVAGGEAGRHIRMRLRPIFLRAGSD